MPKSKPIRKQSKASLPKLKRKAWKVFAAWIKQRDGNTCISCGKTDLEGANWAAGHYIKAELCNVVYRYDARNVHSQCYRCNCWLRGNTWAYREAMLKMYGKPIVEELEAHYKDQLPMNFDTRIFYEEIIKQFGSSARGGR